MVTCFLEPKLRSRQTSRTRKSPHKKGNSAQRAQTELKTTTSHQIRSVVSHKLHSFEQLYCSYCRYWRAERGHTFTFACLLSLCHLGLFSPYAIMARRGTPRQALAHSKFVLHSTSTLMVVCCPDTQHSVFTAPPGAILSTTPVGIRVDSCLLLLNLGLCARG